MPILKLQPSQPQSQQNGLRQPWRRGQTLILACAALIALLSTTVAIAQSSANFDLACRSILASGGGISSGDNFAVIAVLGLPMVPPQNSDTAPTYAVRSADFGVRAGFLPGYPNQQSATVVTQSAPAAREETFIQRLPWLLRVQYIVRGGC
jgi:hypothetical protein